MAYPATLAATLSGATLRQLAYWRRDVPGHGVLLAPEYGQPRSPMYSFRDIMALRMFVQLRGETSLQRIRRAVAWLAQQHPDTHLSLHRLRAEPGGRTIVWISQEGDFFDVVEHQGQAGIKVVMQDILGPFTTVSGRQVPDLVEPTHGVSIDPDVRGGFPVMTGTRIPYDVVSGLLDDGLDDDEIRELYPAISPESLSGASEFAHIVEEAIRPQHAA